MNTTLQVIPLRAKLAYSLWVFVWVLIVLHSFGAGNFFWLCNIAQFVILAGVWRESAWLLSSQAGTVCLIGVVWTLDFLQALLSGGSTAVVTGYMFNTELALIGRASSLYHIALPLFMLWLLLRTGYDASGVRFQYAIVVVAFVGAALLADPERNINMVVAPFGMHDLPISQSWLVAGLIVLCIATVVLPGHLLVKWALRRLQRHISADQSSLRSNT